MSFLNSIKENFEKSSYIFVFLMVSFAVIVGAISLGTYVICGVLIIGFQDLSKLIGLVKALLRNKDSDVNGKYYVN